MQGKLKIKGNMQAALKFTPDVFPKGNLWSHRHIIHSIIPILFRSLNTKQFFML
jgi:hypothetical protein